MEEFIVEVDFHDTVISIVPRSELKRRVFPIRASLVIPQTPENKFILARRAKHKFPYPDVWVAGIGGLVSAGESYEDAARREMLEEGGIMEEVKLVAKSIHDEELEKKVFHIFTTTKPVSMNDLHADPEEVQYFQAFSLEEVERMITEHPEEFASTFITAFRAFAKEWEKR